jgi:dUTP pyrophosphatase
MQLNIQPLTLETLSFYGQHNHNYAGDCGYDLGLPEDTKVYYKATTKINLQVIITAWETISDSDFTGQMFEDKLPCDFLIAARSSIVKLPLRISNAIGVIDKNYRGSLMVCLDYLDIRTEQQLPLLTEPETGFQYSVLPKGMRLIQIIAPVFRQINSTQIVTAHDATGRAGNGFGSTGV